MPTTDYTPDVADVAALLRSRTRDVSGNEVGTFNAQTRPTAVQVTSLIAQAVGEIEGQVGQDLPQQLLAWARHVVSLRVAILIEISYWPEQSDSDSSSAEGLRRMYEDSLPRLTRAMRGFGPSASAGGGTGLTSVATPPAHVVIA